jgi:uncharacterized protein YjbI with pentapeptide repeats
MADDDHVGLLKQGVDAWNAWRQENRLVRADLRGAHLRGADLSGAKLIGADFNGADLSGADLSGADFGGAELSEQSDLRRVTLTQANLRRARLGVMSMADVNLSWADLTGADLEEADLSAVILEGADLRGANLLMANLIRADLRNANLRGANLGAASLVEADLRGADLTGCSVYGVAAWRVKLEGAKQQNLVVTPHNEPAIIVDDIEVAQFMDLMLDNQKLRKVIDNVTSNAVLILGRFTDERKAVLDALREELRKRNYLPILFDFEKPISRDTDETITLLARMARFVIADISDAKAVLDELRAIVPDLPSLPVQPIILATQEEPGMFDSYRNRPSFLTVHRYGDQEQLLADLGDKVIRPAELKVRELRG